MLAHCVWGLCWCNLSQTAASCPIELLGAQTWPFLKNHSEPATGDHLSETKRPVNILLKKKRDSFFLGSVRVPESKIQ